MTALAMIVGMLPMSFSNTQNAPLGRAVIGGLLVATVTTLVFVPCVFAILHRAKAASKGSRHDATEQLRRHRPLAGALRPRWRPPRLAGYGIWSRNDSVAASAANSGRRGPAARAGGVAESRVRRRKR